MPEIDVKIIWDKPDDPYWLNIYNLKLILDKYCPNTKFIIRELDIIETWTVKSTDD